MMTGPVFVSYARAIQRTTENLKKKKTKLKKARLFVLYFLAREKGAARKKKLSRLIHFLFFPVSRRIKKNEQEQEEAQK